MKLKQLSIFLENKRGALSRPCRILAKAGINILTLALADTQQFGLLRIILHDWEKAKALLEKAGCVVKTTDVVAIEVPDRPGGLAEILEIIEHGQVNVEYMYAFTLREANMGMLVFRFDDPDAAIKLLQLKGVKVVDSVEVFGRMER